MTMTNSSVSAVMAGLTASVSTWGSPGPLPSPLPPSPPNHSQGWGADTTIFTLRERGGDGVVVMVEGEEGPGGGGGGAGGGACSAWMESQHTLFQLANLLSALAFLTPSTFRFHLPFLRAMLLLSFLLLLLWAVLLVCMPDVVAWSLVLVLLNAGHLAWLCYTHLSSSLPALQAGLYSKVFRPIKVTEGEFRELCEQGSQHDISKGALYTIEGATPCGYLSVLVKGRLKVTYKRLFLHHVEINQFVDATEYDFLSIQQNHSEKYQVSIAAAEDSVVLRWDYATLQEHLSTRPFLSTVLHYLTGKDVCSQLYALQEHLMETPDYMVTLTSRHSSMVNVRSCLAAQDSSATLCRLADPTDSSPSCDAADTTCTTPPHSSTTDETRL